MRREQQVCERSRKILLGILLCRVWLEVGVCVGRKYNAEKREAEFPRLLAQEEKRTAELDSESGTKAELAVRRES